MYSVLIVDDEEPVLESYSYLVETALEDFSVCATARTGREAIAAARTSHPDVVLMDIAMPGIDGLDTIEELQRELGDVLYILSTAYERFDLAQRAIPLRVFEYLVKPVSRKRFVETMFRAKEHLDDLREQINRRVESASGDQEARNREVDEFMSLITWKSLDEQRWDRYKRLFRFGSDAGAVVLIDAQDPLVYPGIAMRLERRYPILWTEEMRRMVVFFPAGRESYELEEPVRRAVKDETHADSPVVIGIGSWKPFRELHRSYDEAAAALPSDPEAAAGLASFRKRAGTFRRAILKAVGVAEVEELYEVLSEEARARWPFPVAKLRVAATFEQIFDELYGPEATPPPGLAMPDPMQEAVAVDTPRELHDWAHRLLRAAVEVRGRRTSSDLPEPLRRAVTIIERRFRDPIQLGTVAEECGVSAGYLSRLFSSHLGRTFSEYTNKVRIDVALRLLSEGEQSIKEIAYDVGYQDPNYFSRVFKRVVGYSPSDYQGGDDA